MSDELKYIISGLWAAVMAAIGGFVWVVKWHEAHDEQIKDQMDERVSVAVLEATSEMQNDITSVRERVSSLEARWADAREDIKEIKEKIDTLGGHMNELPQRIKEALK